MDISLSDPQFAEKGRALNALYKVIDPELFVNVVDLGLIYNVEFKDDQQIFVTMTLSTPHCPMGEAITNGVTNALEMEFPGYEVDIHVTFTPPWTFEMMSDVGRAELDR